MWEVSGGGGVEIGEIGGVWVYILLGHLKGLGANS